MISGIVAQEKEPLPHGVFAPGFLLADNDNIYRAVVTTGLDRILSPSFLQHGDTFFPPDLPPVLTPEITVDDFSNETIFIPFVAQDRRFLPLLHVDPDNLLLPDIRMPGVLLPSFHVADDDVIFSTPLVLDPGMLRVQVQHADLDAIFGISIEAALTFYPPLFNSDDDIYHPLALAGALGPPFILSDDVIFHFESLTRMHPQLMIDSARPALPLTGWDGLVTGMNISSDNLTAALATAGTYRGARSTISKYLGKYYFEITLGPSSGVIDGSGLLQEGATYTQMSQFIVGEIAVFNNYAVADGPTQSDYFAGTVITNNTWYCHFGHTMKPESGYGSFLLLAEGDVLGMAFNFQDRTAWFRLNGGPWNNNMRGRNVMLDQSPETGVGGIPLPGGKLVPAVCMGGRAGDARRGDPGDSFTANFGEKAFRNPPPIDYGNWIIDSPFGAPVGADSFGTPLIAVPTALDDGAAFVTMSNNNLTATHNTTNANGGAQSSSSQSTGKYYFEVRIVGTHGNSDSVGILIDSPVTPGGSTPEGDFARLSGGTSCAAVFMTSGNIYSLGSNTTKTLGQVFANDVIGVAVDLSFQTTTQGGTIWFRKLSGGVTGPWNADVTEAANPTTGVGGIGLLGFSYTKTWVPCVGFSGTGTAVGDQMVANFGSTPYAMIRPNGFAVWPNARNESLRALQPLRHPNDDEFLVPFIDMFEKTLRHPDGYVHDETDAELIFQPSSLGGNLLFQPELLDSDDDIQPAGYFATFDLATKSSNINLSNGNLTATANPYIAHTGARSVDYKHEGKFYFEIQWGCATSATQTALGILAQGSTYATMSQDGDNCVAMIGNSGIILANNTTSGRSLGSPVNGDIIGCAINLDVRKAWLRKGSGLWNGNATHDPVTGAGGVTIQPLVSFAPAVSFSAGTINDSLTANFGATHSIYAVPLGYIEGWPGGSTSKAVSVTTVVPSDDAVMQPMVTPTNLFPEFKESDDNVFLLVGTGGIPTVGPQGEVPNDDDIKSPSVAIFLATLDPGIVVNVALSNGNLTATHTTATTDSGARSTAYRTSGKYYFEVTMTNIHGNFDCCGLIAQGGTYANLVTNSTNCVTTYKSAGAIYANNASSGKTLGAIAIGDVISIAVDLTARKAWLRKNGGNWNGIATENPGTGVGGVTVAPTIPFAPAVGFGGTGNAVNDVITANFGQVPYVYAAPAGFNDWIGVQPSLATWDGPLVEVTMSGGNLVATRNAIVNPGGVRSSAYKTAGKYYLEVTVNSASSGSDTGGICNPTVSHGQVTSFGWYCVACMRTSGNIYANSANTGKTLGLVANGSVLQYAIDLTARLAWVRKTSGGTTSNWNNDPLANPATGVGGVVMNPLPEMFSPFANFGTIGSVVGNQITLNTGQTTYVNPAPAGFGNWTT